MIDVYYWPTPNGHKLTMFFEETGVDYNIVPVNISVGEQFDEDFLEIAPNNRMPAIVDHDPVGNGEPISIFESGAILVYLADKYGKFIPADLRGRTETLQWLFWQMANLGPMGGQNHHFVHYAPERIAYAMDRYIKEVSRLYFVLDERLADREFIAGDYSIADMACYPWIVPHERQQQNIEEFPDLKRWFDGITERPATVRAYAKGEEVNSQPTVSEAAKKVLFGQDAATLRARARS